MLLYPAPCQQLTKTWHHVEAYPQYDALHHQHQPQTRNTPIHEEEGEEVQSLAQKPSEMRYSTMDMHFKFPPSQSQAQVVPAVPPIPPTQSPVPKPESEVNSDHADEEYKTPVAVFAPSGVEVPPPLGLPQGLYGI
jgi:hypothetical protein